MPKVIPWTIDDFKRRVLERLNHAATTREIYEAQWGENDQTINNAMGHHLGQFNLTFDNLLELESGEVDTGDSDIGMNYAFKYLRFFHSQLSANPPSVTIKPTSTDPADRRKADAADRIARHTRDTHNIQEVSDRQNLNTLLFGTGFIKQVWDKEIGDVHDFNEESLELTMKGDIRYTVPRIENIWIDPDAECWDDVRWVIEKHLMPYEEALFKFPGRGEALVSAIEARNGKRDMPFFDSHSSGAKPIELQTVEVYEMYEKGLPINGMAGRHCYFLESGEILGTPSKNPHYQQSLPYHCFTYIDVPGQVYGKSVVEYVSRLQDMLNRLDSTFLDNIQSSLVTRLLVHEDTQLEDQALSNSSWDITHWTGQVPPQYISPPTLMQDAWRYRDLLVTAIQELFGANDSMMGIQRREQSAISQQTAIEAGTMIHRRLFKKYEMNVKSLYTAMLGLVKTHWSEPRTIMVMGKEKAFQSADFKGADIAGGYDILAEYGASLPIDPNMRRESIMLLWDKFQEAGMTPKQILGHMKLNDLEGMHDRSEMSHDRQREIFEEMLAKYDAGHPDPYIPPRESEDHAARLEYAADYLESSEFKYLPEAAKELIERHIEERKEKVAASMAGQEAPPAAGPAAIPGMPGVGGAMEPTLGGEVMAPPMTAVGAPEI